MKEKMLTEQHFTHNSIYKPPKPPTAPKSQCETDNRSRPHLESESERLQTYKAWPNRAVSPEALAAAGFYSLGLGDVVKCPFCRVEGGHWERGDDPLADHRKWAPDCAFVRSRGGGAPPPAEDVCGALEPPAPLLPGVERLKPVSHELFGSCEARLKSFADWPKSLKQTPAKLAEAGFFYKGVGDQTICFHCGGGLKDWEEEDEPWEQHACWFPSCNYLQLSKGREFVDSVQGRLQPGRGEVQPAPPVAQEETPPAREAEESSSHLCKICYKNEVGVVFIPCGHVVACVDCSLSLKNVCPVCRKHFDASVRAFLS